MTPDALHKFMQLEQREDLAAEECVQIIKNFESTEDKTSFSLEGFTHFMMFCDWQVTCVLGKRQNKRCRNVGEKL